MTRSRAAKLKADKRKALHQVDRTRWRSWLTWRRLQELHGRAPQRRQRDLGPWTAPTSSSGPW